EFDGASWTCSPRGVVHQLVSRRVPARVPRGRHMIGVTVFSSLFASRGMFRHCSASSLSHFLSRPQVHTHNGAASRFGLFQSVEGRRRSEHILKLYGVALDLDESPVPSLEELVGALAGLHAIVFSTWSSTPNTPRWRPIVLLSRPATPAEYPRI